MTEHWRGRYLVACTFLGLAGLVFGIAAAGHIGAGSPHTRMDPRVVAASVPVLDAAQRQKATDLAREDSMVRSLLGAEPANGSQTAPWLDEGGAVVGAWVILALKAPATLRGVWLGLTSCGPEGVAYGTRPYIAERTNVRFLNVLVDLRHGVVLSTAPDSGSHFAPFHARKLREEVRLMKSTPRRC